MLMETRQCSKAEWMSLLAGIALATLPICITVLRIMMGFMWPSLARAGQTYEGIFKLD